MIVHDMMSRNSVQGFARACQLSVDAGLEIAKAQFDGINFGDWYIEVRIDGKAARQLIWEARDGWFLIQTRQPDGTWVDDEVIREPQAAVLEDLIMQLRE